MEEKTSIKCILTFVVDSFLSAKQELVPAPQSFEHRPFRMNPSQDLERVRFGIARKLGSDNGYSDWGREPEGRMMGKLIYVEGPCSLRIIGRSM